MKKILIIALLIMGCDNSTAPIDCFLVANGTAIVDNCGECTTTPCTQDCDGIWGGNVLADNCGVCDSDPENDCACTAESFSIGECQQDCLGIWDGGAELDICGICDGENIDLSECIVCSDGIEMDCFGICDGSNALDCSGVCGGGDSSCLGCTDNNACNYNPDAIEDDGSCINPDENYGCDIFQAYTDFETILITDVVNNVLGSSGNGTYGECTASTGTGGMIFAYSLSNAFPNPFNSTTSIRGTMPQEGLLDLFIVNPNYEKVTTIINSSVIEGSHEWTWDANDALDGYYRAIAVFGEIKCFRNLHKSN